MTTGRAPRLSTSPTLSPVFRLLPDGNCKPRLGEAQRNLSKAGRPLVRFVKQMVPYYLKSHQKLEEPTFKDTPSAPGFPDSVCMAALSTCGSLKHSPIQFWPEAPLSPLDCLAHGHILSNWA